MREQVKKWDGFVMKMRDAQFDNLMGFEQDPEYAKLAWHYEISQEDFNRYLDLRANNEIIFKHDDFLPDVVQKIHEGGKDFYLLKMKPGDKRGLILGNMNLNCQRIGGQAERCVIEGVMNYESGFYLLVELKVTNAKTSEMRNRLLYYEDKIRTLKGKQEKVDEYKAKLNDVMEYLSIVENMPTEVKCYNDIYWEDFESFYKIQGAAYCWLSKAKNLVFDSWENTIENPQNEKECLFNHIIVKYLPEFAKKVAMKGDFERVMIGMDGKTPIGLYDTRFYNTSEIQSSAAYSEDSRYQYPLYESDALVAKRQYLESYIKKRCEELSLTDYILGNCKHFLSVAHIDAFISLDDDIKDRFYIMEDRMFEAITNSSFIQTQIEKPDFFRDFLRLDPKIQTEILKFSQLQLFLFEAIHITELFKAFKADDVTKFKLLTTYTAVVACQFAEMSFFEFTTIDVERIAALTSINAIELYEKKSLGLENGISFVQLNSIEDVRKIEAIVSNNAMRFYYHGYGKLENMLALRDAEKINLLTSQEAQECYQKFYVSFEKLYHEDNYKLIRALVSTAAFECYDQGVGWFAELLKMADVERVKMLTAWLVQFCSKGGHIGCHEAKILYNIEDKAKIQLLLSQEALISYISGFVKFADLYRESNEKIAILTSLDANLCYKINHDSFNILKNIDDNELINLLVSEDARKLYMCFKSKAMNVRVDCEENPTSVFSIRGKLKENSEELDILKLFAATHDNFNIKTFIDRCIMDEQMLAFLLNNKEKEINNILKSPDICAEFQNIEFTHRYKCLKRENDRYFANDTKVI